MKNNKTTSCEHAKNFLFTKAAQKKEADTSSEKTAGQLPSVETAIFWLPHCELQFCEIG